MKVIRVDDYEALSKKAYEFFIHTMNTNEQPVFGLATGSTPKGLYELLVDEYKQKKQVFEHIQTFNLDEYVGLAKDHPGSYYYYMYERFFNPLNLDQKQVNVPNGLTPNFDEECERYEQKIAEAGGIDLQFLGIGVNGHIGFNEPGTSFSSRTHIVELTKSTMEVNSRFFETKEEMPNKAITMGIKSIMGSKEIVLLVNGEHKAEALKQTIEGNVTEDFPASVLQKHPHVTVIADTDACKKLQAQ